MYYCDICRSELTLEQCQTGENPSLVICSDCKDRENEFRKLGLPSSIDMDEVEELLDSMVHDAKSREATSINNGGLHEQTRFLITTGITYDGLKNYIMEATA